MKHAPLSVVCLWLVNGLQEQQQRDEQQASEE